MNGPISATRRRLLVSGACALFAPGLASGAVSAAPADADAGLAAFFEHAFQRDLARSPVRQSRLGLRAAQDRWDDISDEAQTVAAAGWRADLTAAKAFEGRSLSAQSRLSLRMFQSVTQEKLQAFHWRRNDYLVSQMGGMHRTIATVLLNSHPIAVRADAEAYVARLHGVRPLLSQLVVELQRQEDAGVRPPRFVYDLVIGECQALVAGAPFDASGPHSPIWADLQGKLAKADLPAADRTALAGAGRTALSEDFGPAYRAVIAHLTAAKAAAGDVDGAWRLPDGADYYRWTLESYTTLPQSPDTLHDLGLKEVARLQGEMVQVMRRQHFAGSLQDWFAFVRKDPRFYYPDTAAGRQQCLADARAMLAAVQAREPEFLGLKPRAPVEVRAVESWREKAAAKAFYQNAPEDGSSPGIFYVNLYDMGAAPKYQLPVILYHEAVPGHHVETMVAYELKGLPKFRKFASIAAFSEGWGLYSEGLAKELGLYKDDDQEFGRLSLQLMRACRLVVDTGIHARRWTRQQAVDYLDANMPASHYDNQREVDRYIVIPGQATAYYVGMLKILELRARARAALGARFDIRGFHDAVLENGPVPLPILEQMVDAWIVRQGGAAKVAA